MQNTSLETSRDATACADIVSVMSVLVVVDDEVGCPVLGVCDPSVGEYILRSERGIVYWTELDGACHVLRGHYGVRIGPWIRGFSFEFVDLDRLDGQCVRVVPAVDLAAIAPWSDSLHEHREMVMNAFRAQLEH